MRMRLSSKNLKLHQQLTFYPLLWLAIGLLLTFIWMAFLIQNYLDHYLMAHVVSYTRQIAIDVVSIIDRDQETVSAFLISDTIQNLEQPAKISIAIERLLSQNKNFLEGYIVDLKGNTLVGVSRLRVFTKNLPDFRSQSIFHQAAHDKVGISGWENFTENNRPYWYMAIPIERYTGKVIGVLIVTIDLRRIEDVILTSEGAKYGQPILIDHHGIVLVDLDRSKLGSKWRNTDISYRIQKGGIGTASYDDEKGARILAAYQTLRPYGWGLIVQVSPEQTFYTIRNKVIVFFGVMTLIMFVVTGLLTYMAAERVVKPIKELTQAAQKFGRRQILEYKPLKGENEIAQLSAAFYKMAESLRDFEKQRAQYISMIVHDLRNPLTAIQGFLQDLPENGSPGAENNQIKNLDSTKRKMEQLHRMINDLLEFSRLDLGQVRFQSETISVKYMCQDIIAGYRDLAAKFILQPFSEDLCIWADPIRFQQILQNIMDNSLKYTPTGNIVTIDCKISQNFVRTMITDTGGGIPEELLPNLFTPFQTNSLQTEGSYGLGLAIAKKLAIGMNGDVEVVSTPGKGTTFTISLPVSPNR